jgi:hypothetical protein
MNSFIILCFGLLSLLKQSYATNTAYDRVAGLNLTNYWMEIGFTSVDDITFQTVSTYATSFTSPVVFVSAPVYGTSSYTGGYPLAVRIKNITLSGDSSGSTSFQLKVRDLFSLYMYVWILILCFIVALFS